MSKFDTDRLRAIPIKEVANKLGFATNVNGAVLCCFHEEKTPSLMLNFKNTNLFHCFGCNASGDTIALVMQALSLDFIAACKWLENNLLSEGVQINTEMPLIRNIANKPTQNLSGDRFSDIYTHFINPLPIPTENHYLIAERKIDKTVLGKNNVKDIPNQTDCYFYKKQLLKMYSEEVLVASGLLPIGKSGRAYFNFFDCCCLVPFYKEEKINYIQGFRDKRTIRDPSNERKTALLTRISPPNVYIPKLLFPEKKEIIIAEGAIDVLSWQTMGFNAIGISSAIVNDFSDLQQFKDYKLIVVGDADSAGFDLKLRLCEYLTKNNFCFETNDINEIAKNIFNVESVNFKDGNDLLLYLKNKNNSHVKH